MLNSSRCAKINVKVLVILMLITVALGASLFAARQVRRDILSKMDLEAGEAAFENEDWTAAYRHFQEYLGRNPDDVEILKKYAKARLAVRPMEASHIMQAIAAYRRIMQLVPFDEIACDKLTELYAGIGNFEELAYISRRRLEHDPNDREALLSLADALIRLNKQEEAKQILGDFTKELEALKEKHAEYVQACVLMSQILAIGNPREALEWLNKAVVYMPESIEALALRARFYRITLDVYGMSAEEKLELARKDLETANALGTEDFQILYLLGTEWMAHGELDKAEAKLQAIESLPQETLEKYFYDVNDWEVARFLFTSELATKRGAIEEGASLVDEALTILKEKRHRMQVLPSAIGLYLTAGKVLEARRCLDEYLDTMYTQKAEAGSKVSLAYLQALVARAEEKPYIVIYVLQPAVVSDPSRPELWGLLAEAYSRTDQTRRAVSALIKYLRLRPRDPEMTLQLAKEYLKLRDWNRAFETARLAEPLDPTDIIIKLLRIEASIYLAAEQQYRIDKTRLEALSAELVELRKKHPDRVDIRILQAVIAVYLEQPDKAEEELKLAIKECEEPLRAEMQLVRHYFRTKRIAEAIGVCQTACERHSEVAEPWLSLSGLYVANADYDSARSCLRQGLGDVIGRLEKRSISMRLALVELLYGDRATGISLLSEVAAQDEQEVRARTLLLGVREIQEDQATAEKLVGELKQAEGESGLLWRLYQASLWLSSDDWRSKQPDIIGLLQYCIDSDPEWSSPALLLAQMYEKLGDFRRVEDTCRQALTRNPSATDVADKLVTLFEKQGRFSDAEQVLQSIETDPRVTSAWYIRMALSAGDFSRAINELKLRVSNDDRDADSRILLARLLYWQNRSTDQAFAYLNEAEMITPDSMALIAARVSILRAEGQDEEARRILDDYVANSDVFGAYVMRATYLDQEGEFELAEKDYKKLTTFVEKGAMGYELLSNFYSRNEMLDKAIVTLEEGLDVYPEDLGLKRRLMKELFVRARTEDRVIALDILAALEKQLPQDPELMRFRALQMLEESTPQSIKTAREILTNVVELEPTAVDAHLMLIRIAMQGQEYETARDLAIQALGSNPENLALLMARGMADVALGNIQMAVEIAKIVIQREPNNTEALSVLWDAAMRSGNPDLLEEAQTLIKSAVDRDPMNEERLLLRTQVLASTEQLETAISELEAYCQTTKGRSSVVALIKLADLYRFNGDLEQARLWIDRAKQIEPNNQVIIHAQFLLLVQEDKIEQLADISSQYISADEQNPMLVLRAASILSASDSMTLKKEAVKLFEHAVNLSPTVMDARLGLASTLYQTGSVERAKKVYQESLGQNPNNIRILNDLAWILQEHDHNYAAALELANKGLDLAPDNLHLLDTRGTILSNLANRFIDAKTDFERLIELSPSDNQQKARALIKLGRVCIKLNDLDQAKKYMESALEIDKKIDVFTTDERSEIKRIMEGSGAQG